MKCGVREEGRKGSESRRYISSREMLNITPLARYKPKLMHDFARCQVYKRLAIVLKIKSEISQKPWCFIFLTTWGLKPLKKNKNQNSPFKLSLNRCKTVLLKLDLMLVFVRPMADVLVPLAECRVDKYCPGHWLCFNVIPWIGSVRDRKNKVPAFPCTSYAFLSLRLRSLTLLMPILQTHIAYFTDVTPLQSLYSYRPSMSYV